MIELSSDEKLAFLNAANALRITVDVVDRFYDRSASQLTSWSHKDGSPWRRGFIEGNYKWNSPINDEWIEEFFNLENWEAGLR